MAADIIAENRNRWNENADKYCITIVVKYIFHKLSRYSRRDVEKKSKNHRR